MCCSDCCFSRSSTQALDNQQDILTDLDRRRCQAKVMDGEKPCSARVLPFSNYCLRRILFISFLLILLLLSQLLACQIGNGS